jgi:Adenylate and Guanylate cyclase catalytic domain
VRKTVTVLSCDMVDSTPLGERLDPESLRRVQRRWHESMRTALERHGGTVEKFIGDAVMAVFCLPVAHKDDALRVARAAADTRGTSTPRNARVPPGDQAAPQIAPSSLASGLGFPPVLGTHQACGNSRRADSGLRSARNPIRSPLRRPEGVPELVLGLGEAPRLGRRPASIAATMYAETPESLAAREQHALERRLARPLGADLGARPTKQARRRLDALRRAQRRGR